MKTGDADDLARLRQLFSAERESFAEFSDVYCVDAADDVLARFARARRGDPGQDPHRDGADGLRVSVSSMGLRDATWH